MFEQLTALGGVVLVDLVMAGDNAVVVGLAAAGVARSQRARVIAIGLMAAVVLRVVFAALTTQLLQIIGLTLAGGLLLAWVAWKMWRELRAGALVAPGDTPSEGTDDGLDVTGLAEGAAEPKSFRAAVVQIILADVSMSLDNVLAVAGIAQEHLWVLVVGLVLSVALMGLAATLVARLLHRHHWIAYIGLAVVAWVAVDMIWRGGTQVLAATT